MNKASKFLLFIAVILLVVGGGIFSYGFFVKGDFSVIQAKANERTYETNESFSNINIDVDADNVKFIYDNSLDKCKVVVKEFEDTKYDVKVDTNTLNIKFIDERVFYKKWVFSFEKLGVYVYLPNNTYENLTITTDTGDVDISKEFSFLTAEVSTDTGDISFNANVSNYLKVEVDTGNIKINDISLVDMSIESDTGNIEIKNVNVSNNINIKASTGDVKLVNVITNSNLEIKTSTGDVYLDRCDGSKIKIKTSTGDVKGNILTDKTFNAKTSTGIARVPNTSGNICEIETSSGDIVITISK